MSTLALLQRHEIMAIAATIVVIGIGLVVVAVCRPPNE